jgi:hypothetical protein
MEEQMPPGKKLDPAELKALISYLKSCRNSQKAVARIYGLTNSVREQEAATS